MLGMIFLAATTCVATGNTSTAEVMPDVICELLKAETVKTTESGKSLRVEAKLGEEMSQEFRTAPKEDIDKALLGLCIVFGSRILRTESVYWKIEGSDGEILVDRDCRSLEEQIGSATPSEGSHERPRQDAGEATRPSPRNSGPRA